MRSMPTPPTTQALLDEVNNAILAIAAGTIQSYRTPGGQEITKINLYQLRELREQLKNDLIAEDAATSGFYRPAGYRSGGAM